MNGTLVVLTVTLVIHGQELTRNERMPSIEVCWQQAPERMDAMLKHNLEITAIAVTCGVDRGKDA